MHIRDLAFSAAIGALIGLGAYLVVSPNLPFWPTIGIFATLATAAGGILHATRRTQ